jgi:hydrogenase maturation protease
MTAPRILVAGIGNVFLGDDGFGVEVVGRLARRSLPDGVRVADFGIRGFDLTYALLEDWDAAILVDATVRGGAPGTVYVIEPELPREADSAGGAVAIELHAMDPLSVLRLVRSMGGALSRLRLVGCEPRKFEGEDGEMAVGLSDPVEAAVHPAMEAVERLVASLREEIEAGA